MLEVGASGDFDAFRNLSPEDGFAAANSARKVPTRTTNKLINEQRSNDADLNVDFFFMQ